MNWRKGIKISAIILGALVLLAAGMLVLVKVLVTPEMIRKNVLPRIEKAMNRHIEMADARIGLWSGISLSGLKIYEPDGKGTFISLGEARLKYQLLPLLSRRVVVDEIVIKEPQISVIRNADGSFNFSDLIRKKKIEPAAKEEKTPVDFAVAGVEVSDGRVTYDDRKGISGSPFTYRADKINIDIRDFTTERPFPLEVKASVPGADVDFSGTVEKIKETPTTQGSLTVNIPDLAKMVSGLPPALSGKARSLSPRGKLSARLNLSGGVKAPAALLKDGEIRLDQLSVTTGGKNPMLSGTLLIAKGAVTSRDLTAALGANKFNVALSTSPLEKKPLTVTLNATSPLLDLDSLAAGPAKPTSKPTTAAAGKTEPGPVKLPLSAGGTVTINAANYKGMALSDLSLRYALRNNVLRIEDFRGSTAGGTFRDDATVNLGVRGFSYSSKLNIQGVQAEKVAAAFASKSADRISGILSATADISGTGATPASMKRNLKGSGTFEIKNGKITGSGFAAELARLLGSQELRIVRFSSFAGNYRINDQQVQIDSSLDGSDIRMKPTGRIGFDKSLDMSIETRIAPHIAGKVARGQAAAFLTDEQGWGVLPLKATGTVNSPRLSLSSKAIGRRIGEKIGESLRKTLEKDTGTGQKPGLEETIRGIFGR